jgi:hypothetical protein
MAGGFGEFVAGGVAQGFQAEQQINNQASFQQQQLKIQAQQQQNQQQRELYAKADKARADLMSSISDTIEQYKIAHPDASPAEVARLIAPVKAHLLSFDQSAGRDPTASDAQITAMIATPSKAVTESGWGKAILNSGALRKNLQTEYGIKDITDAPLMPLIDAWKKAADDLVGSNIRNGSKNTARTISQARDSVLDVVRQKNPALSAWAGKSKYLDAIEEGKGILGKVGADELRANLAKLGDSEKEGFRLGAVSSIISKMRGDPAKLADLTKYLRSPEVRDKVAAIMPSKAAADAWKRRLDFEVGSSELIGQSLRNSATARRQAEMADANGIVGDLVLGAFSGGASHSLLRRLVVGIGNKARDTFRSRTDAELAKLLTRSPQGLSGKLAAKPLLPPLPYRGVARGAFQAGRASNVGGQ